MHLNKTNIVKQVSFLLLLLVGSTFVFAKSEKKPLEFSTRCVGDANATQNAIFLHGMRPIAKASAEAQATEKQLETLAKASGVRIAIPQSHTVCQNAKSHYCWGSSSADSIASTYAGIMKSAGQCFDTKKPFVVIGFSDGGYHLSRAVMRCLDPQPKWSIAIGSAGNIAHATSSDLSKCSKLTLLVGKSDQVLSKAKSFEKSMKAKQAQVDFKTYAGGHVVPYDLLAEILTKA